ncbi:MAG: helix-turn-helix domain-containing protein [Gemmatimonas sp.]
MERGVRFGRKPKLTRHQRLEALARREAGEPLRDIGRSYNVSHITILRLRRDEAAPGYVLRTGSERPLASPIGFGRLDDVVDMLEAFEAAKKRTA